MMDLRNPRTWDDATLDSALPTARQWDASCNIVGSLDDLAKAILAEDRRRGEIRMERQEFGTSHPAEWYDPRPEGPAVAEDLYMTGLFLASYADFDPESPIGYGATRDEAIADLNEKIDDRAADDYDLALGDLSTYR